MAARFGLTAGGVDVDVDVDVDAEAEAEAGEAVVPPLVLVPLAVVPAAADAGWSFRCGVPCPIIRRAAWSGLKVGVDELALLALLGLEMELLLELAFLLLSFLAEVVKYLSKLSVLDAAAWFLLAAAALVPLFLRPLPPEPAMIRRSF